MGARFKALYRQLEREIEETVCLCQESVPPIAERIGVEQPEGDGEEMCEECEECGGIRCVAIVPYYRVKEVEKNEQNRNDSRVP
jgi:hypothetical protein